MTLHFHNTLTRKKEPFTPIDEKNVRMYVCGPTVYDRPHLGNARSVVVYDVLYRLLCHLYGKEHVTYVRNVTDVDDKINAAAKANKEPISALTGRVEEWFHDDMKALNVLMPNREPHATQHIKQMISMIEKLIAGKHAYAAQGHVLFAVVSYGDYGALSGRKLDELVAGARVEVEAYKKHPGDFVLWKPAEAGDDPSSVFDSPWGKGRPGWHIECSAMSTEYLGRDFDIHGGGADLMFPHHENEIAQSRCALPDSHFANYWVHNGFLTVNGEKMSKSLGNFVTVKDLLDKGVKGEVIRLALLSTHYRSPLDWTQKAIDDAKKTLDYFYRALGNYTKDKDQDYKPDAFMPDVITQDGSNYLLPLLDDLNISQFFTVMVSQANLINTIKGDLTLYRRCLYNLGNLLGVLQQDPEVWFKGPNVYNEHITETLELRDSHEATATFTAGASFAAAGASFLSKEYIEKQKDARIAAKKAKNFSEADRIRKELADQGIILEDRPDGTTDWRRA